VGKRACWTLILSGIVVAAILGGTCYFAVDAVDRFRGDVNDRFRFQSGSKLVAFTRLARDSLIRGQTDFLETAAELLLASSAHTVQVVVGETVALNVQREGEGASLDPIAFDLLTPGMLTEMDAASLTVLDLTLPIESASSPDQVVGYVRIVFDRASVVREIWTRTALIIGIAAAIGIAVLGAWIALLAVLRRRTRRTVAPDDSVIIAGPLRIDTAAKRVTYDSHKVELTPKQFTLLCLLAAQPNHVYPDQEIVDGVWPDSAYASSSDVKQCIYTLRRRLRRVHPEPAQLIANVQGYGYKLAIPELEKDLHGS